jgi:hypothetical protein
MFSQEIFFEAGTQAMVASQIRQVVTNVSGFPRKISKKNFQYNIQKKISEKNF